MVGSAHYILGPFAHDDSDLRRHGLKIAERGGKNAKKRAAVAVARKRGSSRCYCTTFGSPENSTSRSTTYTDLEDLEARQPRTDDDQAATTEREVMFLARRP